MAEVNSKKRRFNGIVYNDVEECVEHKQDSSNFTRLERYTNEVFQFSLCTSDGHSVHLPRQLWESSKILMQYSAVGRLFETTASHKTVEQLLALYESEKFPLDYIEVMNLFALVKQLDFKKLLKCCFDFYCSGTALHTRFLVTVSGRIAPGTPPSSVLRTFEMLCSSVARTTDIYDEYMRQLEGFCTDMEFLEQVARLSGDKALERCMFGTDGLPCKLDQRTALIGLLLIDGALVSTVFQKTNSFRTHIIDWGFRSKKNSKISDFFLLLDDHIVYRENCACVYYRDLKNESRPVKLMDNVIQFLSMSENLFLLRKDDEATVNQLFLWTGKNAIKLRSEEHIGEQMSYCDHGQILCFKNATGNKLILAKVAGTQLIPFKVIDVELIRFFMFYDDLLYVWSGVNVTFHNIDNRGREGKLELMKLRGKENQITDSRVTNGILYLKIGNVWHVLEDGKFKAMYFDGILTALNEFSLNPYLAETYHTRFVEEKL